MTTAIRERQRSKTYDMAYISMFTVIIAICSWISIPMTVPFTLQTFGVFAAVGILGGRREPYPFFSIFCWEQSVCRCSPAFQEGLAY